MLSIPFCTATSYRPPPDTQLENGTYFGDNSSYCTCVDFGTPARSTYLTDADTEAAILRARRQSNVDPRFKRVKYFASADWVQSLEHELCQLFPVHGPHHSMDTYEPNTRLRPGCFPVLDPENDDERHALLLMVD